MSSLGIGPCLDRLDFYQTGDRGAVVRVNGPRQTRLPELTNLAVHALQTHFHDGTLREIFGEVLLKQPLHLLGPGLGDLLLHLKSKPKFARILDARRTDPRLIAVLFQPLGLVSLKGRQVDGQAR